MDIPAIVKELVFAGGSLIVPGLGRFSIIRMPAEMDISKKIIAPPFRLVQFDELRSRDDGKLTGFLAERYRLGTAEASQAVSSWAKSIRNDLSEKGKSVIEGFGTLESGPKGISFRDDPFILYSSLLPKIEYQTAMRNERRIPEKTPVTVSRRPEKKNKRIPVLLIIIAFILLGISALYYTGFYREILTFAGISAETSGSGDEKRIVFGRPRSEGDSLKEAISRDIDESTLKENALSYNQTGIVTPSTEENTEALTVTPPAETVDYTEAYENTQVQINGYHIIAGSYLVPNNAERQQKLLENRGFKPIILPPQGNYYMVSLGSYNTLEQVTEVINSLRSELEIPLWVKKI